MQRVLVGISWFVKTSFTKSDLRHRLIGDDATRQKPIVSVGATPVVQRASRLRSKQTDGEEEMKEWQCADTGTASQDRTTAASRQAGKAAKSSQKCLERCQWGARESSGGGRTPCCIWA